MAPDVVFRTHTFPSGAKYKGTFLGSQRHGHGISTYPCGEVYEGEYIHNRQEGWGLYEFPNGRLYLGGWSDNKLSGQGIYYFSRERTPFYVGGYKDDKKHGGGFYQYNATVSAAQRWDNGELVEERVPSPTERLDAAFLVESITRAVQHVAPNKLGADPHPEPRAVFSPSPSGAVYEGERVGEHRWGIGLWRSPGGDYYAGEFVLNELSGWGTYIYANVAQCYTGHWKDSKMDGWGVYTAANGSFYVGEYYRDSKHGSGMSMLAASQGEGGTKVCQRALLQSWEYGKLLAESVADEKTLRDYMSVRSRIIEKVEKLVSDYL